MAEIKHWSCTKFMTWDQCPGEFKARYVDGVVQDKTEAMVFGEAVHKGLEAHFRGEDGMRVYRVEWKRLAAEVGSADPNLTAMGMDLIEQVMELGLEGEPERGFSIDSQLELGAPIVGYIDLWTPTGIIDFKTTKGTWSQARAQKEMWQPSIYTWARWLEDPAYTGNFEYIVLNRTTGTLQRFQREWTTEEVVLAWNAAWARARTIADLTRADCFECHGKHGSCPECGDRWSHEHVCNPQIQTGRIRLHAHRT